MDMIIMQTTHFWQKCDQQQSYVYREVTLEAMRIEETLSHYRAKVRRNPEIFLEPLFPPFTLYLPFHLKKVPINLLAKGLT